MNVHEHAIEFLELGRKTTFQDAIKHISEIHEPIIAMAVVVIATANWAKDEREARVIQGTFEDMLRDGHA